MPKPFMGWVPIGSRGAGIGCAQLENRRENDAQTAGVFLQRLQTDLIAAAKGVQKNGSPHSKWVMTQVSPGIDRN